MKLTFCYQHIAPYHQAQLNALALAGIDVTVITFDCFRGTAFGKESFDLQKFTRISLEHNCRKGDLDHALFESTPDILLVPGWGHSYAISVLKWANAFKIPCVVISDSQECDHQRNFFIEKIKKKIISMFSAGFVAGKSSFSYMSKLGMPTERLAIGCDVVDNEHFSLSVGSEISKREMRLALALPDRYFLAVNRLAPEKNLNNLILAYANYCAGGHGGEWGLVIIGSGVLQDELGDLVACLNIHDKVQFRGAIGYAEMPVYYFLASTFILASVIEPWGLVVNEAMSAGLPVLVSNKCGSSADLIYNGQNGFQFEPMDVEQLSKLMTKMSSGELDLNRMGLASRNIISEWTVNRYVAGMKSVIEMALHAPAPSYNLFSRMIANIVARLLSRDGASN